MDKENSTLLATANTVGALSVGSDSASRYGATYAEGGGHDNVQQRHLSDPQQQQLDATATEQDLPDSPLTHLRVDLGVWRSSLFATFPVFANYASMIAMQRGLRNKIGITNHDKERSDIFGTAVGTIYLGNLLFRLLHNIIFSWLVPRQRVMLAYCLAVVANLTIGFAYWVAESTSLAWVFVAYLLSGVAIGSFESNVLSTIVPLGHATKGYAVLGLPMGFQAVAIGFFVVYWIASAVNDGRDDDHGWLHGYVYFIVAVLNVCGLLFFVFVLPTKFEGYAAANDNVSKFFADLKLWRQWLPKLWPSQLLALFIDMFFVSTFSGIVYYIYDHKELPIWPFSETTMPDNAFQVWFNSFGFCGDFFGRRLVYNYPWFRSFSPLYFCILSVLGGAMVLSKTALIAPFGFLLVMGANGMVYASCARHIDAIVEDRYNLVALSVWLFTGDVGSYIASLLVQPLQLAAAGHRRCAAARQSHSSPQ
jgi:MFS family permease